MKIAVLVNPEAGRAAQQESAESLRSLTGRRGFVREVGTPESLREFAVSALDEGVTVVAICGGDGTLGRVATAVADVFSSEGMPALALLGGGTMNTTARSLGARKAKPADCLARLLGDAGSMRRKRQGTMQLAGGRLGFMIGAGVPARFLALYERAPTLGAGRAIQLLLELIASATVGGAVARSLMADVACAAELDGRDLGLSRVSLLYASTIDEIGLGFRPTPRARAGLELFQVLAGAVREMDLVRALPRIWSGAGVAGKPWIDACGKHLRVAFDEPTVYMVDGDVEAPVSDLEIRIGPAFDILVAGAA